jgi:hypothetical protein
LASYISWTRLDDNWHHREDVIVGAIIGIVFALLDDWIVVWSIIFLLILVDQLVINEIKCKREETKVDGLQITWSDNAPTGINKIRLTERRWEKALDTLTGINNTVLKIPVRSFVDYIFLVEQPETVLAWTQQRSALGFEEQTTIATGAGVELETGLMAGLLTGIGGGFNILRGAKQQRCRRGNQQLGVSAKVTGTMGEEVVTTTGIGQGLARAPLVRRQRAPWRVRWRKTSSLLASFVESRNVVHSFGNKKYIAFNKSIHGWWLICFMNNNERYNK